MGDQLKSLFDAIDSLGHSKKQNDKDEFQAEVLKRKLKKLIKTSTKTENDYQNILSDRDKLRIDLKEITAIIKRNNLDKETLFT